MRARSELLAMAITSQSPDILGERQSGQDVRTQNGTCLLLLLSLLCNLSFLLWSLLIVSRWFQWWRAKRSPISSNHPLDRSALTRYLPSIHQWVVLFFFGPFHFSVSNRVSIIKPSFFSAKEKILGTVLKCSSWPILNSNVRLKKFGIKIKNS